MNNDQQRTASDEYRIIDPASTKPCDVQELLNRELIGLVSSGTVDTVSSFIDTHIKYLRLDYAGYEAINVAAKACDLKMAVLLAKSLGPVTPGDWEYSLKGLRQAREVEFNLDFMDKMWGNDRAGLSEDVYKTILCAACTRGGTLDLIKRVEALRADTCPFDTLNLVIPGRNHDAFTHYLTMCKRAQPSKKSALQAYGKKAALAVFHAAHYGNFHAFERLLIELKVSWEDIARTVYQGMDVLTMLIKTCSEDETGFMIGELVQFLRKSSLAFNKKNIMKNIKGITASVYKSRMTQALIPMITHKHEEAFEFFSKRLGIMDEINKSPIDILSKGPCTITVQVYECDSSSKK